MQVVNHLHRGRRFDVGGDLHVGVLELDESALSWVVQVSLPVRDPQTDMAIGAITIAVNPSLLERSI